MLLSASLIVKNEEGFLEGCLRSIRTQVDEIVVVDTGSTDRTPEIARAYGARVISFPWAGSFAEARNAGLDACSSDWILYIDADERLCLPGGATLRDYLQPEWLSADVCLRPRQGYTPYLLTRLFRRRGDIRFEGHIHETITPSLERLATSGDGTLGRTDVLIVHLGYEGDIAWKRARDLPLLRACVESAPDRVYYWHHLAETLLAMGAEDEAITIARRGLATAALEQSPKSRADAAMLCHLAGRVSLGRGEDAEGVIAEGLRLSPGNHALLHLLGQREVAFGDPARALAISEALLATRPEEIPVGLLSYSEALFGALARWLQLSAFMKLGRMGDAARVAAALATEEAARASGRNAE